MEIKHKGFTISDDGTILNKFGNKVGSKNINSGYVYVSLNGNNILAHRLIWEAFNGEIPEGMEIDHINTIRSDNRLENLRLTTIKENRNNSLTKAKYKESNKGKISLKQLQKIEKRKKPVFLYKEGKLIAVYESVHEAAKQLKSDCSTIKRYCRGWEIRKGKWYDYKNKLLNGFKLSFNLL